MSKKLRKTLGGRRDPHIKSLMRLIETQSKMTISNWCIDYAKKNILPIFEKHCPGDNRPRRTLNAAEDWLAGNVKLPYVKNIILNECHAAARELENMPAAQAAARCCGQVAACIHTPTHSLGLVFYGTAAIAYDSAGTLEKPEVYGQIAKNECAKMEAALRAVAVTNEENPAKINWNY